MLKLLVVALLLALGLYMGRFGGNPGNSHLNGTKGYPYSVDEPNDVYYGPQADDPVAAVYFGPLVEGEDDSGTMGYPYETDEPADVYYGPQADDAAAGGI